MMVSNGGLLEASSLATSVVLAVIYTLNKISTLLAAF